MNKLFLILGLLFSVNAWAVPPQLEILGQSVAPNLSTPDNGSIYFDPITERFQLSANGQAYEFIATNNTAANPSLSNLAPTSINQDLIPQFSGTFNIGTPGNFWQNASFSGTVNASFMAAGAWSDPASGNDLFWNSGNINPDTDNVIALGTQTDRFSQIFGTQVLAGNMPPVFFSPNTAIVNGDGHVKSTQTTPPNVSPLGAASCTGSNTTDTDGMITMQSTIAATGAQCVVDFTLAYNVAPICQLTPANAQAATVDSTVGAYVTTQIAPFSAMTINFAVGDLGTNTYQWFYHCAETQ